MILVTTAFLDHEEYFKKTVKYIKYYQSLNLFDHIYVIDNASLDKGRELQNQFQNVTVLTQLPFLPRKSHLEYPYLWRGIYSLNSLFEKYNKIIYTDNDFYILSEKMINWIRNTNEGWNTVYCNKYNFNETGFQLIHKSCEKYKNFVADGEFWKYNGKTMETTLPVTNVNKDLIGNRWSEMGLLEIPVNSDFSAQTPLDWKNV